MRIFSHKKTFKRPNFLSKVIKTIFPLKLAEKGFIINRAMVEVCRVKFKTFSHEASVINSFIIHVVFTEVVLMN